MIDESGMFLREKRIEKEKKEKEGKLWEWMGLFLKIQQEIDFDKTLKPNER